MIEEAEHNRTDRKMKKPYESPEITRVRISGDEMASAGCKSTMISLNPPLCQNGAMIISVNRGS